MEFDNGYATGYSARRVRWFAKRIAERLEELGAVSVVVRGNSGVSAGFAALVHHDFDLFLARKPGESSHGAPIEGPANRQMRGYYILDEFTSSGATIRGIIRDVNLAHRERGYEPPPCLGILLYKRGPETEGDMFTPVSEELGRMAPIPIHGLREDYSYALGFS